jgi:hypothetical protein
MSSSSTPIEPKNAQAKSTAVQPTSCDPLPPPLSSAPPPWHAVALVGIMIAVFVRCLPTWDDLDAVATVDVFTHRVFPHHLSLLGLALLRGSMALLIWGTSLHLIYFSQGWTQITSYLKGSKLRMVPNQLSGWKTMFPFTSWSWNFLGLYFTLSSYIAYTAATTSNSNKIHPYLLRSALIAWEIAGPNALLVANVIRYAIWPAVLKANTSSENLKKFRNILMHNSNVAMVLCELALWGGVPVYGSHFSVAPLVGCAYILMTWNFTFFWNRREEGPQFIYFFFDTTLPGYTPSLALLALLAVLTFFYALLASANQLVTAGGGLVARVLFVLVGCSVSMRFND